MQRRIIILLMLLMLIPTSLAFELNVTSAPINCTDYVSVKIIKTYDTSNYTVVGCRFENKEGINDWWTCDCNRTLIMNQDNPNVSNIYDITYEYFIGDRLDANNVTIDNNRRTHEVSKFRMGDKPLPSKLPDKDILTIAMYAIIAGIVIVVGLGLYFLYAVFIRNEDNVDDGKKGVDMSKQHGSILNMDDGKRGIDLIKPDSGKPIIEDTAKKAINFIKPNTQNEIAALLHKYKK